MHTKVFDEVIELESIENERGKDLWIRKLLKRMPHTVLIPYLILLLLTTDFRFFSIF